MDQLPSTHSSPGLAATPSGQDSRFDSGLGSFQTSSALTSLLFVLLVLCLLPRSSRRLRR
jgi:hypothetical protein